MATFAESGNRTAKAIRIVALIDDIATQPEWTHGPVLAIDIPLLSETAWECLANATGGRPISPATRGAVQSILEARDVRPTNIYAGIPS